MPIVRQQRADLVERWNRQDLAVLLGGTQGGEAHRQLLVMG